MEDLMEWLINYAFDHHIGVQLTSFLQPMTPSTSFSDYRLVVINTRWHKPNEIPFSLAHEIGHVMNGDCGVNAYTAVADTGRYKRRVCRKHYRDWIAIEILPRA